MTKYKFKLKWQITKYNYPGSHSSNDGDERYKYIQPEKCRDKDMVDWL